jgi:hypothetical protein
MTYTLRKTLLFTILWYLLLSAVNATMNPLDYNVSFKVIGCIVELFIILLSI